jgi:hypothetical protein
MVGLPRPPPRLVGHDGVFGKHACNAHSEDCAPYKEEPAAEVCCCFVPGSIHEGGELGFAHESPGGIIFWQAIRIDVAIR